MKKLPLKKAPKAIKTITGAELCQLTGLTDRRHRQLAADGLFPKPKNGLYDRQATLAGISKRNQDRELTGLRKEKMIEEIRKLRTANDRTEAGLQDTEEARAFVVALTDRAKAELGRILLDVLPPLCEGLDAPQIRVRARDKFDEFCQFMIALPDELMKEESAPSKTPR